MTETEIEKINRLTQRIIGCAIEVHRVLGPGLLEALYERALSWELEQAGLTVERQVHVPVYYKALLLGDYRLDLVVEDSVVVEVKSVERHNPVFDAQMLTYLRITKRHVGLLLNFNTHLLRDGIKRFIL